MPEHEQSNPEEYLTDEQREASERRAAAYERSGLEEWDPKDGSLLFDIDPELISTEGLEVIAGGALQRKPEYHVTIIGRPAGKAIREALGRMGEVERVQAMTDVATILESLGRDWQVDARIQRIEKAYPAGKDPHREPAETRTSFIQMVEFDHLAEVYRQLNERLGLQLETPPTHITVMTGSTNPAHMNDGIGLPTMAALEALHPKTVWPTS